MKFLEKIYRGITKLRLQPIQVFCLYHVCKSKSGIITEDNSLASYIKAHVYFPSCKEEKVSFSTPEDTTLPVYFTMQLGDGDSFA